MTQPDEQSPLLPPQKLQATPLPWGQFSLLLIAQLAEPITGSVLYPFAPDLCRRILRLREEDVGFYVGILESIFFLAQACTVMHWSRLSDVIGRKPVLLCGLSGLALSMYCFGLSQSFWQLVLSRCLNGALNGNVGVMKSTIAELTDATNVAQAIGWLPVMWNSGTMLGPIIGGFLSRPAERFPTLFGNNSFLKKYPYFLACAAPASYSLAVSILIGCFLRETNPSQRSKLSILGLGRKPLGKDVSSHEEEAIISKGQQKSATFSELLRNRRVLIAGGSYALLSLVDMAYVTIQPTFLSTPVQYGGLGWSPAEIGRYLSVRAVVNGLVGVLLFAPLVRRFGPKTAYMLGTSVFFPIFALYRCISWATTGGNTRLAWAFLGIQAFLSLVISVAFGSVMIYINSSAPNRKSIGATNGICQLSVSVTRAIGPFVANALFSLTIKEDYLGGSLVYIVLMVLTGLAVWAGTLLPREVWTIEHEEE